MGHEQLAVDQKHVGLHTAESTVERIEQRTRVIVIVVCMSLG
jgi:hypothetical protein